MLLRTASLRNSDLLKSEMLSRIFCPVEIHVMLVIWFSGNICDENISAIRCWGIVWYGDNDIFTKETATQYCEKNIERGEVEREKKHRSWQHLPKTSHFSKTFPSPTTFLIKYTLIHCFTSQPSPKKSQNSSGRSLICSSSRNKRSR